MDTGDQKTKLFDEVLDFFLSNIYEINFRDEKMKIISWNVNGIRAVIKKGFYDFIDEYKPDILCLQETKAHPEQVDIKLNQYPYQFWNSAEKKVIQEQQFFLRKNHYL